MSIRVKDRSCSTGGEFHLPSGHKLWFVESRTISNCDYIFKVYKGQTPIVYVNCWFRDSEKFMLNFALKGFQKDEIIDACIKAFAKSVENDPGLVEYNQENEKTEIEYRMQNLASLLKNLRAINESLKKAKGLEGLGGIPYGAFKTRRHEVEFRVGYNPIMTAGNHIRVAKQYAKAKGFSRIEAILTRNKDISIVYVKGKDGSFNIGTINDVAESLSREEYRTVCEGINAKQYIYDKNFECSTQFGAIDCGSAIYFYIFADGFIKLLDYGPIY